MAQKTNSFERFWQELKRRKVFGVVTTYAATAYIIIEVVNNLIGPFRLPDWIPTLIAFLLAAGLPLVIVLSWIFDFTPQGIKKTESYEESETQITSGQTSKRKLKFAYVLNAVLLMAVIVLAYPRIFKHNTLENIRSSGERISVAVMPFQNKTNNIKWDVWQDGVQDILISSLSNSGELKVRQAESIISMIQSGGYTDYASITPSVAKTISQKLDVHVFICGSINIAGPTLRINAQLIDSNSDEVFKAFQIDGTADKILPILDSLALEVKNFLIISNLKKGVYFR